MQYGRSEEYKFTWLRWKLVLGVFVFADYECLHWEENAIESIAFLPKACILLIEKKVLWEQINMQLTVIVDKFLIFFKICIKKKLRNTLYCLFLRFPNFQQDTLKIKKVNLNERINV